MGLKLKDFAPYKVEAEFRTRKSTLNGAIVDTIFSLFGRKLVDKYHYGLRPKYNSEDKVFVTSLKLYVLSESELKKLLHGTQER